MAEGKIVSFNKNTKNFIWIFSHIDFSVIDIVDVTDYEISVDEETNAQSIIMLDKDTGAVADDIIAFKRNNVILYWGVIDSILNTDGTNIYQYTCRYLTNMFNQDVALEENAESINDISDGYYRIVSLNNPNYCVSVKDNSTDENAVIELYERDGSERAVWKFTKVSGNVYTIQNVHSKKYLSILDWKYSTEGTQYCQSSTQRNFEVIDRDDQKFSFFVSRWLYKRTKIYDGY